MAIGWPFYDPSWSPTDPLPDATPMAEGLDAWPDLLPEETLDLELVRAAIEDGLLMVFGPDGDPIPPEDFRAAAAERPQATIPLRDGRRVAAERIAAVLKAQTAGRLGSGDSGAEAWIEAMLGLGAQPAMADARELQAEDCAVQVMAFGKELLITTPTDATFLLAEARSRSPDSVGLHLAYAGPIAVSELVGRLLAGPGGRQGDDGSAPGGEFAAPGCPTWLEGDELVIDLPEVGPLHLARKLDDGASGALASVFTSSGATASLDDLVRALHQRAAIEPQPAAAPFAPTASAPDAAMAPAEPPAAEPHTAMAPAEPPAAEPATAMTPFQPAIPEPDPAIAPVQPAAPGPEPAVAPFQPAATEPEAALAPAEPPAAEAEAALPLFEPAAMEPQAAMAPAEPPASEAEAALAPSEPAATEPEAALARFEPVPPEPEVPFEPAVTEPDAAPAPVEPAASEPEPAVSPFHSAIAEPEPAMAPFEPAASEPDPALTPSQPAPTAPEATLAPAEPTASGAEGAVAPFQPAASEPELAMTPSGPGPAMAPSGLEPALGHREAAGRPAVPLRIDLPGSLAAAPDDVALVVIRGLPEAASLSAGVASGDGSWLLSPRHLAGLSLTPPPTAAVDFLLEVVAIAVASQDGELTSASHTVTVSPPDASPGALSPIPLALDPEQLCPGGPFDAILVLDVPAGAALSAGTYDPEIDAWILLPRQLAELSIIPGRTPERDVTLSLLGVCLRPGAEAGPRILAKVPLTIR